MDLKKTIDEMKEKLKNRKPGVHPVDLEKGLRSLKTELYIKRDEVKQLRTDLDAANLELQNLRGALENTKKSSEEHQFNLNLVLKKSRHNEEELQEKRETLMKIQLQHKMSVAEVHTLKERLLKTEMDKIELSRKIDVFESKQRHNSKYQDEILKRDNYLRNFVEEVNKMVVKLEAEHMQAIELSKKAQLANEAIERLTRMVRENEKLKKEKEQFEEMYIQANAKFEKLQDLMARDVCVNMSNLITEIVFNQWKANTSRHVTQIKQTDEILSKMSESLASEKGANRKLVFENEKISEKNAKLLEEVAMLKQTRQKNGDTIEELNKKIKEFEEKLKELHMTPDDRRIKEEPIEID